MKKYILENGILFVTKEKLNEIDLKLLIPKSELLQNLDKFKLKNVLIILLIIVMLVIGYRYYLFHLVQL